MIYTDFCNIGENFVYQEPVSVGGFAFNFLRMNDGQYRLNESSKKVDIGDNITLNSFVTIERGFYNDTKIGDGTIIDSFSIIGHDAVLGKGVQIGPNCSILGHVEIGDFTKVFAGTTINPKVKIGKNCIIGVNSYVRHDVPDNTVVFGNPAETRKDYNYPHKII